MAHSYDVGTKAWQPDPTEGWVASEVISKTADGDKIKLVFELANGEVCLHQLHKLQNASNTRSIKANFTSCDRLKR